MNKILMLMISVIFSFSSALAEELKGITDEGTATTVTAVIEPSFNISIPQQYKDEELAKSVKMSGNIDESSVKISHSLVSKKIMNYSIKIN